MAEEPLPDAFPDSGRTYRYAVIEIHGIRAQPRRHGQVMELEVDCSIVQCQHLQALLAPVDADRLLTGWILYYGNPFMWPHGKDWRVEFR